MNNISYVNIISMLMVQLSKSGSTGVPHSEIDTKIDLILCTVIRFAHLLHEVSNSIPTNCKW